MNPNEYQSKALQKEADQSHLTQYVNQAGDQATRFTNGIIGLTDEVGELAAIRKSWLEQERQPDPMHVLEECGDVLWRTCQILASFNLTLQEAMESNLAKLNHRYKARLTPEEAHESNRDRPLEAQKIIETVLNIRR